MCAKFGNDIAVRKGVITGNTCICFTYLVSSIGIPLPYHSGKMELNGDVTMA